MTITENGAIRIISGVRPHSRCGVYDYSERLAEAIKPLFPNAEVLNVQDWRIDALTRLAASLLRHRGVLHVQFPSQAMAKRIAPHLVFCSSPFATRIITFHEFSRLSWRGKLLALPSVLLAHQIIASHEGEAEAITRTYPFVRRKVSCIPIGSNIPSAPEPPVRDRDLCFFGMIGDNPQVRQFLEVVRRTGLGPRAVLIGHAKPGDPKTRVIVEEAEALGVELAFDLPSEDVGALLATVKVALLPYEDGISERRGAALAAMANGTLVVTIPPKDGDVRTFEGICLMADKSQLTETTLRAVTSREQYGHIRRRAKSYAARRSWDHIAAEHVRLYQEHSSRRGFLLRTT